jgi:hypothetical protein
MGRLDRVVYEAKIEATTVTIRLRDQRRQRLFPQVGQPAAETHGHVYGVARAVRRPSAVRHVPRRPGVALATGARATSSQVRKVRGNCATAAFILISAPYHQ